MANSFTNRLCQVDDDNARQIALSPFVGALITILDGKHTTTQVKNFYNMTATDKAGFNALIARVNARSTLEEKTLAILHIGTILNFWEQNNDYPITGYTTPDEIEARLLEI